MHIEKLISVRKICLGLALISAYQYTLFCMVLFHMKYGYKIKSTFEQVQLNICKLNDYKGLVNMKHLGKYIFTVLK